MTFGAWISGGGDLKGRWANWGGNYSCSPHRIELPESEQEISSIVQSAARDETPVKVVGSGHSFTDIACTRGTMIRLDRYNRVLEVDHEARRVTVQAGIRLEDLNRELSRHGLALENLGDIAYQTVAGAISTGTHGTGAGLGSISTQVVGMTLVRGDGEVVACSAEEDAETLRTARVGLGALGVLSTVTFQCVPAFKLRAVERKEKLDDCLRDLDDLVDENPHFEFFWWPHTDQARVKIQHPTEDPITPRGRVRRYYEDVVMENRAYGAICRLGKARQSWIPGLNRFVVGSLGYREMVGASHEIFATPRLVRFVEMEYAIPRSAAAEAIRDLKALLDRGDIRTLFPVEVRFMAGDDIPLSPAFGRPTCTISVHVYRGMPYETYFREVEQIMRRYNGRPHWGKMHYLTAPELSPLYPHWEEFLSLRGRLDPTGVFRNDYLQRVLGVGLASAPSSVRLN